MAPYRLPLFPLTVVVFPGTPQPLHIFEPRYRRLLKDCLAGNRRFGITLPGEKREAPEPGAVGCAVEIGASEDLPDGRSNILVVGRRRFVVRQVIPDSAPYHVGLVEEFDDDPASAPGPVLLGDLRSAFLDYYRTVRLLHDAEPDEPELPAQAVALSFQIAAALECELGLKHRLLATRSTGDRIEVLLRLLPTLTAAAEAALRVHRRAHRNGRGGAHSVLPSDL